jgi:hypothetical protein
LQRSSGYLNRGSPCFNISDPSGRNIMNMFTMLVYILVGTMR